MMGTRAAAFAGKISNLRESIQRSQNGTMPQPTCIDLANMLKYFSQVLHDFRDFKDIENIPLYASEKRDRIELIRTLPNFDYSGLYKTLTQLVDILPLIPQNSNGLDQLGNSLLMLFKCLMPFLDQANMETLPYLVATLFMSLPQSMHKDILDTLCFNLLPFTIDQQQRSNSNMIHEAKQKQRRTQLATIKTDNICNSTKVEATSLIKKDSERKPTHCIVKIDHSYNVKNEQSNEQNENNFKTSINIYDHDESITMIDGIDTQKHDDTIEKIIEDTCQDGDDYAALSVTSILMVAFHYITEPIHCSQLVECLMKLKSNVFEDLLFVIAYGTTRARCPAVEILFRYWPDISPNQQDRKTNNQSSKLKHIPWQPIKCQNKNCSFTTMDDDEAVKMCLDFKISITLSGLPPPMLVCLDCVDAIYKQQLTNDCEQANNNDYIQTTTSFDGYGGKFIDLLLPMERISKLCENKKCKSTDKSAIGTCFDIECANYNSKRPIRYCKTCFKSIHEPCELNNYDVTLQNHIRHSSINLAIMESEENVNNFVEAIISLLKEAAPADRPSKDSERYLRSLMGPCSQFNNDNKDMNIATEEKQLISQYGIWLMTGLCKTVEKLSDELLGRLLGMLFQWFHFTACLPDDQAGSALEKLKSECIKGWILDVKVNRLEVFISCLLPHPIDCSKIGGHWEVWPDTAHQIKEGFKRLLCLVPYDIITDDVWDEIMPYWMECFRHEVPENELNELKILLSKVFDPELSPLGFATKQMYNFILSRFADTSNTNQEQTLYWLQIITMLEIPIPIELLFQMLKSGVKTLAEIRANELIKLKMNEDSNETKRKKFKRRSRSENSTLGSANQNQDNNDLSDSDTSNSEADSHGSQLITTPNDDDVLLPNNQDGQDQSGSSSLTRADQNIISQQERQARARAAFSAKLAHHASLLDAQHSGSLTSPPETIDEGQNHGGSSQGLSGIRANEPAIDNAHTRPSESTAYSETGSSNEPIMLSTTKNSTSESQLKQFKTNESQRQSPKPKLKLNLSSADEASLNKIDNNLVCYILMMDILLKQLDLQEVSSHRGLDSKEAQQAIELLNAILSTPWAGKHTCCDSLPISSCSPNMTNSTSANQNITGTNLSTSSNKSINIDQRSTKSNKTANNISINSDSQTNILVHSFSHCAQGFEHEDNFETCVFCEIISTFHQLSMSLIEFFSPLIEVSICEVSQDAANGEFDGKPDYSRIGLDHLGPSPRDKMEFSFDGTSNLSKSQIDPALSPFSPSYMGPTLKQEVLETLPNELQLAYNLLVQFHQYQTPDIVSQLLQMIKLVSLHSQVLNRAAKNNPQFISWCQHNMLVNKLWSLCQLESSEIARTCVPLLLHCITLPWGVRLFRDLLERDFNNDNWLSRFRAVERVITIAYFCEPSTIKNSTLLQSTMASAFCYVVRCLDDIEAIVAQRALVSLEMMKTSSLKLLLWCLEVQFDYIIIDRPIILRTVFQLYNHLRDRRFLSWEFFLNRFDTIFLEAQIYLQQTGEIPSFTMQDLKNTNTKSEIYQKKIARAKEALMNTNHSRSLSSRFPERRLTSQTSTASYKDENYQKSKQSMKLQINLQQNHDHHQRQESSEDGKPPGKKSQSVIKTSHSPIDRVMQHGQSISSRYQSVAYLTSKSLVKRKNSKFMSNLAMQSVPPLMLPDKLHQHLPNSFVDDGSKLNEIAQENHVFGVVHRICDEDRDTNHLLIFLLMQFFSKPDSSHPQTVKTLNRSHQIVLRHLNILMGYSVARKNFLIAPANLRLLPVFNAFLTSLPKVLDFNYSLGSVLLDTCLPVLIYCPAPDNTQYDQLRVPTYSLWLLNPLMRQSWLMSVMSFLYKYQFGQPHLRDQVRMLMWIVVNTLESHLSCSTTTPPIDRRSVTMNASNNLKDQTQETANDDTKAIGQQTSASLGQDGSPSTSGATILIETPAKSLESPPMQQQQQQQQPRSKTTEVVELVELHSRDEPRPPLKSINRNLNGEPQQQSSIFNPSPKLLTKADTSDSLNVKAKIRLRKIDLTKGAEEGRVASSSASSSSNRITVEQPTETEITRAPVELAPSSDERLLPIGLGSLSRISRLNIADQPAERLLPIGLNNINLPSGKSYQSHSERRDQSNSQSIGDSSCADKNDQRQSLGALSSSAQNCNQSLGHLDSAVARNSAHVTPTASKNLENPEPEPSSSHSNHKAHRKRFGNMNKHHQNSDSQQANVASKDQGSEPSGKKAKAAKLVARGEAGVKQASIATMQPSYSSPSLLNEQLAQINRHSIFQEFSDKDLSMCLVILETFIHHEPSMAAQMLPNILRLVARYSSASLESWQTGSNVHLVGGSMFVARQFIRVALHDLMENNIFHQIFTSHFTGPDFYKSMATALADFADLNQLAPLSKLFEDLNKQKNLPEATTLMTMLENVATYFECIIAESTNPSQSTWNNFINNWENFLRKLILALPRFTGQSSMTSGNLGSRADGTIVTGNANNSSILLGQSNSGTNSNSVNQFFPSRMVTNPESSAIGVQSSCSMIMAHIMRIILSTSKISHLASCKTIVDPYSKIISYTVLNSPFKYEQLLEINHNCYRLYTRDREKYLIQRTIAYELVQVLKFRFFILEENLLLLLLFVLQDVGGTLAPKVVKDGLKIDRVTLNQAETYMTNVSECLRQYTGDLLEFITDVQAISRINDNLIGSQPTSINRDSFGGHVKAAISQYLALEMSLNNGNDNRTILRYLPWLYSSPSLQQGPREFIDCISHIRQLSWILLGALEYSTLVRSHNFGAGISHSNINSNHHTTSSCQPIPIEKNSNVAEHVQVILAGFAEQSKESVLHMSSLFHAFLLCQLWTMYCENICNQNPANSEQYQFCQSTLDDFWAKITPGILRLVGHSRVMSEMVSTHFLQLIESLIESNSSNLIRYLPMWNSVFFSYKRRNKSGNLALRLQKCIEWQPPDLNEHDIEQNNKRLINWLEKVQYKMSHIEIQSSQAGAYYLT